MAGAGRKVAGDREGGDPREDKFFEEGEWNNRVER